MTKCEQCGKEFKFNDGCFEGQTGDWCEDCTGEWKKQDDEDQQLDEALGALLDEQGF